MFVPDTYEKILTKNVCREVHAEENPMKQQFEKGLLQIIFHKPGNLFVISDTTCLVRFALNC